MCSNPTRTNGYFYDSHHKDKKNWQTLKFNSLDSPLVDEEYVNRIIDRNGANSDEYRIRVLGDFPKEDSIDSKGYVPLILGDDLNFNNSHEFVGQVKMGVDPAGEGLDVTSWVIRDNYRAKIIGVEKVSNPKSIAQKTLTLMTQHNVLPENVAVDNFGVGANVSQELALGGYSVNSVNVGDKPLDEERFMNLRAESYWRIREWLKKGGELTYDERWKELLIIKYRRELSGKIKIMSKREMAKEGFKSPNHADALMLTFVRPDDIGNNEIIQPMKWI